MHGRIFDKGAVGLKSSASRKERSAVGEWLGPATCWLLGASHIAAAARVLQEVWREADSIPLKAAAAIVCCALGLCFAASGCRWFVTRHHTARTFPPALRIYWQCCGGCLVVCYASALLVSAQRSVPYVFLAALTTTHAAAWFLLSGPEQRRTWALRLFARRRVRWASWTLYVILMLPLACELGLRLYAFAVDDLVAARYVTGLLKLHPGDERLGRTVNSQGYWDDEFHRDRAGGVLRIAALGDELALCGDAESNFLCQVERLLPGVDVLNFGVAGASPREYAAQLDREVAACHPDLVLVCLSVASDITEAPTLPGPFEWHGLHLVQRSAQLSGRSVLARVDDPVEGLQPIPDSAGANKMDSALRQLQVCRIPVRDSVQAHWQAVFRHLDEVIRGCRNVGMEPMLVVVPCEFQVDDGMCRAVCRQAGYRTDQIDIDLPQRRLAAYAKDRRVQMLDLLPHLKASSQPAYCTDNEHFNSHGHALAATILCDWLESQYGPTLLVDRL